MHNPGREISALGRTQGLANGDVERLQQGPSKRQRWFHSTLRSMHSTGARLATSSTTDNNTAKPSWFIGVAQAKDFVALLGNIWLTDVR